MEVPIRRILRGEPLDRVLARDAMSNPASIDWYIAFAEAAKERIGRA
jgi:acetoacetyl-CoA synthetase